MAAIFDNSDTLAEISEYLSRELNDKIVSLGMAYGELNLEVHRDAIIQVLRFLRDDPQTGFINIIDICGVDYPAREERFDVVYHLMSPKQNARIRVRITTNENTPIKSATKVFRGADWFEREAYDMYGILFTGHPDLRRLLTDYGFDGHPLRKDFPLTGHVEVRYDDEARRVIYEPVELRQEYRDFDFESPWEGTDYGLPNQDVGADKGRDN